MMKKAKVLDPTAAGQGGKNNIIVLSFPYGRLTPAPNLVQLLYYWITETTNPAMFSVKTS